MRLEEFLEQRKAAGVSTTAAVEEITAICCVKVRNAWRWVQEGQVLPYAARLMTIWAECSPVQRERWFNQ